MVLSLIYGCQTDDNFKKVDRAINQVEVLHEDTSFNFFWIKFRSSVINNNIHELIKNTNFPLETRGPQDSDEITKYDESEFQIVFQTFLKEDSEQEISEFDLIMKLEKYELSNKRDFYLVGDWARVGEMEFKKIDNKWKLNFLYLYYGTIDEINYNLNKK